MVWNHRVVKRNYERSDGTVETTHAVHKTYYDKAGAKGINITSIACDASVPEGATLESLRDELGRLQRAVTLAIYGATPVLNHEDF